MSKTAAERQKAYRDKKRNAQPEQNVTRVTVPDGSTVIEPLRALHAGIARESDWHTEKGQEILGDLSEQLAESTPHDAPQSTNAGAVVAEHPPDTLFPGHRNLYSRPDGTRYLIDATGNRHEWPLPVASVRDLSDIDLQLRLKGYPGAGWINTPEHKEVMRRRSVAVVGAPL